MEISCKSEYALLALIELAIAYESKEPLQIRQISVQQNIPDRYLEQLLAMLRRGGIVRSQRGAKGGYLLAREPWKITLFEILACLEGFDTQPIDQETALKSGKTLEGAVICEIWHEAQEAANAVFQKYTLKDLCERRDARRQLDFMYYI
ncbi:MULTISPECIES: RrF2 family transcriptional regulator [Leptolyngbya]|uniref:BadM/Rrf2 family transcriptional regulator n=2 Tax=Leptolyngbya boryana TaxID=1184 RepID=A0A1Z4JKH2_LEPBY|nr:MULTISPECIES: Rrf2 family transcriptional regulator [Leptolyngbya]MBD1857307.1 Rrf2 family transcriptional regulator [Leptolyngbya sp. FACHB-1624]MBD2367091.1 Rrf2 family transcriptional regulator [Leptolyngbya sp. FACHB-161]MBD2373556.1 Rrf2 family transcriptional regulator [Leptolyngbya sp. FACHB-238]MBD2397964.1 Rrf2 family transcriptional regulator [Leptolyngbya sp. FACHB-239]MBD2404466.1 Rrf2 family transcriptional regulator [Leptolyngbya sp. FACHB-402]BAY57158.1 BadM/Rrf2 family tran